MSLPVGCEQTIYKLVRGPTLAGQCRLRKRDRQSASGGELRATRSFEASKNVFACPPSTGYGFLNHCLYASRTRLLGRFSFAISLCNNSASSNESLVFATDGVRIPTHDIPAVSRVSSRSGPSGFALLHCQYHTTASVSPTSWRHPLGPCHRYWRHFYRVR